jgi:S-adenosylmethionine:tRNA ribosyltransferase-isomerase
VNNPKRFVPEILVKDYAYSLPDERIARYPAKTRDESSLLVLKDGTMTKSVFSRLPEYLPPDCALVFNNSRVIRARIRFAKRSGAEMEIFCLHPIVPSDFDSALSARGSCSWSCLVGNAKRWKDGKLEKRFSHDGAEYALTASATNRDSEFSILFEWDAPASFSEVLECCGEMPIPPYLKRDADEGDSASYQTVFSRVEGSVAAPTAGLHFTAGLLDALDAKGIDREEITLHVGAGTFRPMKSEYAAGHTMHRETFVVDRALLERLHEKADRLVAVGTTSARMLESLYRLGVAADERDDFCLKQWEAYGQHTRMSARDAFARLIDRMDRTGTARRLASTEIMIVPGYRFGTIKGLITNFHQPESTLILLVAAFAGERWREVYEFALNSGFRFLSYGDASLLIP